MSGSFATFPSLFGGLWAELWKSRASTYKWQWESCLLKPVVNKWQCEMVCTIDYQTNLNLGGPGVSLSGIDAATEGSVETPPPVAIYSAVSGIPVSLFFRLLISWTNLVFFENYWYHPLFQKHFLSQWYARNHQNSCSDSDSHCTTIDSISLL